MSADILKLPKTALSSEKITQLNNSANNPPFYIQFIGFTYINGIAFYEAEIGWIASSTDVCVKYSKNRYSSLRTIYEWNIDNGNILNPPSLLDAISSIFDVWHHAEPEFPPKGLLGQSHTVVSYRMRKFQEYFSKLNTIRGISKTDPFIKCFGLLE